MIIILKKIKRLAKASTDEIVHRMLCVHIYLFPSVLIIGVHQEISPLPD